MATPKEREEFAAVLTRELPEVSVHKVLEFARFLIRVNATLMRLHEESCNRLLTEDEEKRGARLEERVKAECERLGLTVRLYGNALGPAIDLRLPSGRANSWGGEGWWYVP